MKITAQDARLRKNFGLVMILATALGAVWLAYLKAPSFLYGNASKKWPQTTGIIAEADVVQVHNKGRPYHHPKIRYRYWVGDVSHEGTRFRLEDRSVEKDFGGITNFLDQYKPGNPVTVFYNPINPSLAVLIPGIEGKRILVGIFGFVSIEIVLFLVIILLLRDRNRMNVLLTTNEHMGE